MNNSMRASFKIVEALILGRNCNSMLNIELQFLKARAFQKPLIFEIASIEINEEKVKDHLGNFVRETVEETLNAMLDAEADQLCKAQKHERSAERQGYRSGHYQRNLHTKAGAVKLKVPKLKKVTFESAIIERYKRREISVEEAMVEMYLAGVSVRRVEDITEALWGTKVSPGTISNLNKKIYEQIEKWRNLPLAKHYP